MQRQLFVKSIIALELIVMLLAFRRVPVAEILDANAAKTNPLVTLLSKPLGKYTIDVIQDYHSSIETKGNPVLVPLPDDTTLTVGSGASRHFSDPRWGYAFYAGVNGIIVGVKRREPIDSGAFRTAWDEAPADARVIITFNMMDDVLAQNVSKVLKSRDFQVFPYFSGGKDFVKTPDALSYYMQSTENCLVLDTKVARRKGGVLSEALAQARYRYKVTGNVIYIYGKDDCIRTQAAVAAFRQTGATVNYYSVDKSALAADYVFKYQGYLEHHQYPLVFVDGKPFKFSTTNFEKAVEQASGAMVLGPHQ